jgi:1-acylglycerone phosphate reductase
MAKRTDLIAGCSRGGLGDALARESNKRGLLVFVTGRNPDKLTHFNGTGIETVPLDVLSEGSIKTCVSAIAAKTGGTLDILSNNSGSCYSIPLSAASLPEAQQLLDLNVFSVLAVEQAFLPPSPSQIKAP